ncbi:MAG: hypothetical protein AAF085_04040 [Planctomycetota bacterium]
MSGGKTPLDQARQMNPVAGLALSLIMPWRACRGAWQHAGVWHSLLYHVAGLFLFFVGLMIIDAALWYGDIIESFTYLGPGELPIMLLFVAVWAIFLELCYMLTAWLTSSWGSGPETLNRGVGRSLSRWYQLTPFHAVWTLALLVGVSIIDEMRWNYWDYSDNWQFWEFVFSGMMLVLFMAYCGVGGWFTLRALAVPRTNAVYFPKSRWPALCESCGYPIVGLDPLQPCPECGRVVESSLKTPRGNEDFTTLAKMRMALINPAGLGEVLQAHTRTPGAARALAISALTLLLTGPIGVMFIFITSQIAYDQRWFDDLFMFLNVFLIGGLGAGLGAMVVGVVIVLAVGSMIGLIDRLFGKRYVLTAAGQATCYASGYAVFMVGLMYGFTGVLTILAERFFDNMGYGAVTLLPMAWIVVCLLLTLPYFFIVGRIVRGMRYANA